MKLLWISLAMLMFTPLLAQDHHGMTMPVPLADDNKAWEMILTTACDRPTHTPEEKASRPYFRLYVGLDKSLNELNAFCAQLDAAIAKNTREMTDAKAKHQDATALQADFILSISNLVQDTIDKLQRKDAMAFAGLASIIQAEQIGHMQFVPELDGMGVPVMLPASYHGKGKLKHANWSQVQTGYTMYSAQYTGAIYDDNEVSGLPMHGDLFQTITISGAYTTTQCTWNNYSSRWEPVGCPAMHSPQIDNRLTLEDTNWTTGTFIQGGQTQYDQYLSLSNTIQTNFMPGQVWKNTKTTIGIFCSLAKGFILWKGNLTDLFSWAYSKALWLGTAHLGTNMHNICDTKNACLNPPPWALNVAGVDETGSACKPTYRCIAKCDITVIVGGTRARKCPTTLGNRMNNKNDTNYLMMCWGTKGMLTSAPYIDPSYEMCTPQLVGY